MWDFFVLTSKHTKVVQVGPTVNRILPGLGAHLGSSQLGVSSVQQVPSDILQLHIMDLCPITDSVRC